MSEQRFPPGWNAERVERLLAHYESLSEQEQVAEDEEAAREQAGQTVVAVPDELLPRSGNCWRRTRAPDGACRASGRRASSVCAFPTRSVGNEKMEDVRIDFCLEPGEHMKTVEAKIPDRLDREVNALVEHGWFRGRDHVFQEAIRRFLEAHRTDLMAKFIREDVEWGMRGRT